MAKRTVFVAVAVSVLFSSACAPDGPDGSDGGSTSEQAPASAPEVAGDTSPRAPEKSDPEPVAPEAIEQDDESVPVATDSSEPDGGFDEFPSGPLYLPTNLPDGWTIRTVTTFPEEDDARATSTFVAHPSEGGFAAGGVRVGVVQYDDDAAAVQAASAGQLGLEPTRVSINGFGDAYLDEEPNVISALSASVGSVVVRLTGSGGVEQLVVVAEGLTVDPAVAGSVDAAPTAVLDLPGWELEATGSGGSTYELGFDMQGSTLSVLVSAETSRASLYLAGDDYEAVLLGDVGEGFYAIQRIESDNLEFPRIVWWVPDVLLSASPTTGADLIVTLLDSFVEVDDETFAAATADATFAAMEVEFDDTSRTAGGDETSSEPRATTQLDASVVSELVAFIENYVGRTFEKQPEVLLVDRAALISRVPPGSFVPQRLWDLFRGLGLVPATAERLDADAVRAEQVRGVCCPVQLVEQEDPAFNKVVIVHELTHGLDTELNTGAAGTNEPVDAIRALVEGSAHRVAFAYGDTLIATGAEIPEPPALFDALDARLPASIREALEFPYDEGLSFASALVDLGGEQAIVDAFANPPTTSEQILDPDAYLSDEGGTFVDRPEPPEDGTTISTGTIGAFTLRLLLEPAVTSERATELALAWSGDAYTLYGDPAAPCVAATIEMDDSDAAATVAAILAEQSLASGSNDVVATSATVSLTRCADA